MTALAAVPCAVCRQLFEPRSDTHRACRPQCAQRLVVADKKREAAEMRARREAMKSPTELARDAQAAVNRYVRLRDHALGCVSCDKPATWDGQWHASHFMAAGDAPAVRFNLWNIAKSCSACNRHKSGNLLAFEPKLRARIGSDRVAWLRTQTQRMVYAPEYLRRLKRVFNRRANRLEKCLERKES